MILNIDSSLPLTIMFSKFPDRSYELKRKLSSPAHNNVDLNGPEDDQNGDDIVSSYKTAKKSRLESPAENSNFEVTKKSASPEKRKGGHPSTPIISKEKIVYVSKYFARHIPGIATTEPANQEKIDSTSPLKIDESDEEEIVAKKMKSQKRKSKVSIVPYWPIIIKFNTAFPPAALNLYCLSRSLLLQLKSIEDGPIRFQVIGISVQ